jgi:hypothetical protein
MGAQMINQFEGGKGSLGRPVLFQGEPILKCYGYEAFPKWGMIGYVLLLPSLSSALYNSSDLR